MPEPPSWLTTSAFAPLLAEPVCRLGLAGRGNTHLRADDVLYAVENGVNYLNWCAREDGFSRAIATMGEDRRKVIVAAQFSARSATEAQRELDWMLRCLRTDTIDILTFYYVEHQAEWDRIIAPDGAYGYCRAARDDGRIRWLGLTSHQRSLAASIARTGMLDLVMIRYNAAHRGAERDVFPITADLAMPVVAFTCLRWGDLLHGTPDDPAGFDPPSAPDWYRFVLSNPLVAVALAAPDDRKELEEDLAILSDLQPPDERKLSTLRRHGERVRRHCGYFP